MIIYCFNEEERKKGCFIRVNSGCKCYKLKYYKLIYFIIDLLFNNWGLTLKNLG